jgi:hypothetical protein
MRKPRTPYLKLFINIQSKRWQHAHVHTLLPAHSLHISSLQDRNTATQIHVSSYRLHFTISIHNKQTHILKKLYIPDSPLRLTSSSTLLYYNINTKIRTAIRIENIQILYSTNSLHHTIIKHSYNFKGVLDSLTNGPMP